jgi:hypothetical protein
MLQMEPRVPRAAWLAIRAVTVAAALSLIGALFADPTWALSIFWGIFIPLAPLLFFLAPGLWRNICPLAAVNQIARVFRFSRGLTLPRPLVEHGYLIPVVMLFGLIPARRVLFNTSGTAVGALLLGVGALAFFGGIALKGKSGWCSTFCPLLPVQRIYGQTPFAIVRNSHCEPCLGCAKNCFDFNPQPTASCGSRRRRSRCSSLRLRSTSITGTRSRGSHSGSRTPSRTGGCGARAAPSPPSR